MEEIKEEIFSYALIEIHRANDGYKSYYDLDFWLKRRWGPSLNLDKPKEG